MILTSLEKGLFTVTLNYPEKYNCIGVEMLNDLMQAVTNASTSSKIRAFLIRGAGDRAFSSGANIKEFNGLGSNEAKNWIELGNAINNAIETLKKPTVAYINGYALGGGLELALACDFRLVSKKAVLAMPEVSNGWLPGWGGMTRLRKLIGEAEAKRLILLSEKIDANTAKSIGIITKILEEGQEEILLNAFMDRLMKIKPIAYAYAKAAIMDEMRTTSGSDIDFDILAMQIAKETGI